MLGITSSVLIELANILVLCCTGGTFNLVSNFVSLVIICEFDNYIYLSLKNESFRLLVDIEEFTEEAFTFQRTTSKKCHRGELSKVTTEEGIPLKLRVHWNDRRLLNKIMYVFYKFMKALYTSVYFYFMPYLAIIFSTMLPLIINPHAKRIDAEVFEEPFPHNLAVVHAVRRLISDNED